MACIYRCFKAKSQKCNRKFCDRCLEKHYNQDFQELKKLRNWVCYSCQMECVCAACKRERGLEVTRRKSPSNKGQKRKRRTKQQIQNDEKNEKLRITNNLWMNHNFNGILANTIAPNNFNILPFKKQYQPPLQNKHPFPPDEPNPLEFYQPFHHPLLFCSPNSQPPSDFYHPTPIPINQYHRDSVVEHPNQNIFRNNMNSIHFINDLNSNQDEEKYENEDTTEEDDTNKLKISFLLN